MRCVAILAFASLSCVAQADVVDLSYLGKGAGINARVTSPIGTSDLFAGQLSFQFANGTGVLAGSSGQHFTFCPDLYQVVSSSSNQYTLTDLQNMPVSSGAAPMGAAKAAALNNLFAQFGTEAVASGAAAEASGAFQLAIWEIVYESSESGFDLTSGAFRATNLDNSPLSSAVLLAAQQFAIASSTEADGVSIVGLANPNQQDQLWVPTPGALALISMGGLIAGRRRR
jgi:hypothetical protein